MAAIPTPWRADSGNLGPWTLRARSRGDLPETLAMTARVSLPVYEGVFQLTVRYILDP